MMDTNGDFLQWFIFFWIKVLFMCMQVNLLLTQEHELKLVSHLPKKKCFIYFYEIPLQVMENAFYFILKALFILKVLKLLS